MNSWDTSFSSTNWSAATFNANVFISPPSLTHSYNMFNTPSAYWALSEIVCRLWSRCLHLVTCSRVEVDELLSQSQCSLLQPYFVDRQCLSLQRRQSCMFAGKALGWNPTIANFGVWKGRVRIRFQQRSKFFDSSSWEERFDLLRMRWRIYRPVRRSLIAGWGRMCWSSRGWLEWNWVASARLLWSSRRLRKESCSFW
jgi:hypothetical protein